MSDTPAPASPTPHAHGPKRERLTVPAVRRRITDFAHNQYMLMHALLKGVTIGVAATTLPFLLGPASGQTDALALWLASGLVLVMNYVTTSRGTLLVTPRFTALDVFAPMTLAAFECLLFLLAVPAGHMSGGLWFWYFALAGYLCCVVILLSNRIRLTRVSDFAPSMASLATDYLAWITRDRLGALLLALASVTAGLVRWQVYGWSSATGFDVTAAALIGVVMLLIIRTARHQRAAIAARIEALSVAAAAAHAAAHPAPSAAAAPAPHRPRRRQPQA